jgi:hypothetical protein
MMKDIAGFEGKYAVTEDGKVWSYPKEWSGGRSNNAISKHQGKWLAQRKGKDSGAYYSVSLCKSGKPKSYYVHILVAKIYIPNPSSLPEVNHKDGNRLNNNHSNLEWCTRAQNLKHAFDIGLNKNFGETHYRSALTWDKVKEIRDKYIPHLYTMDKLAEEYGVSKGSIQKILENRTWKGR